MTSARDEILARIGTALGDRPAPAPIPRAYRPAGSPGPADLVGLFDERVADYQATVRRCAAADLSATLAAAADARGAARLVVPAGVPADWLAGAAFTVVGDDPPLAVGDLDRVDGVLTGCTVAIAETGTIVLDHGPGQGRRALTLVPDYHLVVVLASQLVPAVPDAVAALDPHRPQTWISGPSATSDIELSRVEGVHGPRTLDVVIVTDA